MSIEATNQIGAGTKFTDRSGRTWEYGNYMSPSGPAFWLTLPNDLAPEHAGNYTVHFDGTLGVVALSSSTQSSPAPHNSTE